MDVGEDFLAVEMIRNIFPVERHWSVFSQKLRRLIVRIVRRRQAEVAPMCRATRQIPYSQDYRDDEKGATSNHTCDERGVDLLDGTFIARQVGLVETFSGVAGQENARIAKDTADQVVHLRLREHTLAALGGLRGRERGWAFDDLSEKVVEVDGAILTAKEAVRDAAALNILALVVGRVLIRLVFQIPFACIQLAIERFQLIHPELKVASMVISFAGEGDLRLPVTKHVQNCLVRYVAHLEIPGYGDALFVASSIFPLGHHGIARAVCLADITVDATPALLAVTRLALSYRSVFAISQRTTRRL